MAPTKIDTIMAMKRLPGPEKRRRIFAYLVRQPDRGVQAPTGLLLTTEHRHVAEYLAQYLEGIPGAAEAKTRAAQRLRRHSVLVRSVARLVFMVSWPTPERAHTWSAEPPLARSRSVTGAKHPQRPCCPSEHPRHP
ncbi:hypothetical protein Atai01_13090 [Amycolatopsis taiwanensis]|uniref:Uncharacterized protein n=1 Tax=Amycolatopsis taiwanensis TaxID=342230 RepID=A0A9W6QZ96_9PSEU|nr:hypothetical protein Atai01_13090 [Amycolatopsis taiwanensis]